MAKNKDKTQDQEQNPKKKRSKLKLALVALPILVLLGVGGYFAYTMFQESQSGPDQKAENGEESTGEANATRQAEAAMVDMPTLLVNLADPLGKRYLKMTASLEVNSQEAADRISSKMPKIKDSMIMLLSSKTYEQLSSMENKILLKKGIVKRLNQILGTPVVRRVYFTEFIIQ